MPWLQPKRMITQPAVECKPRSGRRSAYGLSKIVDFLGLLVSKLVEAKSVQIALRLPSPDLAKAREIAARKGIGYQTLLKMLVHEGLQRAENQPER